MRLGAKGYRVTVIDRLDRPGGRGSSITDRAGTASTLARPSSPCRRSCATSGPPAAATSTATSTCARWTRSTRSASHDGRPSPCGQDAAAMRGRGGAALARRPAGLRAVPERRRGALLIRLRGSGPPPDAPAVDLIKVLPTFAMLRADRSVYAHAAAPGQGRAPALCAVVPSAVHRRRPVPRHLDVYPGQPSGEAPSASTTRWAACRRLPTPWSG